jgi:hypothetical protein
MRVTDTHSWGGTVKGKDDRSGQSELADVPLATVEALIRGSLWSEPTPDGFIPVRLPEQAWSRVPNLWAREMFRMASGVRLCFVTHASSFELDVSASVMTIVGGVLPDVPVTFDLTVDGVDHGAYELAYASVRTLDVSREPTFVVEMPLKQVTLRVDGLAAEEKTVELWFPANAVVEVTGFRATAPVRGEPSQRPRWVHHGSSISHCREVERPTHTWPAIAARLGELDLLNLGVGGNSHLDPFVARAIRDTPADVISLEVGPNIVMESTFTRRTFVPALAGFLDTIRDGHPETPLYVVSPIVARLLERASGPLGIDEAGNLTTQSVDDDAGWPLLSLERVRELTEKVVASHAENDPNVVYVDGLELFGPEDIGDLADGFHPTPQGYETLGRRFNQTVLQDRRLELPTRTLPPRDDALS